MSARGCDSDVAAPSTCTPGTRRSREGFVAIIVTWGAFIAAGALCKSSNEMPTSAAQGNTCTNPTVSGQRVDPYTPKINSLAVNLIVCKPKSDGSSSHTNWFPLFKGKLLGLHLRADTSKFR